MRVGEPGIGHPPVLLQQSEDAGARGVDLDPVKLALAQEIGAVAALDGREADVPGAIREISQGGAHVSLDAHGHPVTMTKAILCLRPRGKHVQAERQLVETQVSKSYLALTGDAEYCAVLGHALMGPRFDEGWVAAGSGVAGEDRGRRQAVAACAWLQVGSAGPAWAIGLPGRRDPL
ncbi:zinc-binding dehydrogenase [Salipiger bermudensis]|uniref:zinc-binding dehydrogenase n=1 Tax=Salipiger bermudensis TaxID=344736 RepID=UPI003AB61B3F